MAVHYLLISIKIPGSSGTNQFEVEEQIFFDFQEKRFTELIKGNLSVIFIEDLKGGMVSFHRLGAQVFRRVVNHAFIIFIEQVLIEVSLKFFKYGRKGRGLLGGIIPFVQIG